jgi:hypothetical protein
LGREFAPIFETEDFLNLPLYRMYVRLAINDGHAAEDVSTLVSDIKDREGIASLADQPVKALEPGQGEARDSTVVIATPAFKAR